MDLLVPTQLIPVNLASPTTEGVASANSLVQRVPAVESLLREQPVRNSTARSSGPDTVVNISSQGYQLSRSVSGVVVDEARGQDIVDDIPLVGTESDGAETDTQPVVSQSIAGADPTAQDAVEVDSESTSSDDSQQGDTQDKQQEDEQQENEQAKRDIEKDVQQQQQRQVEQQVSELSARDREVRVHEAAHAAVGGQYAGSPSFGYDTGPDGRRYAVSGEVPIDASPVAGDPEATLRKMRIVQSAALAPADPSEQDRRVAALASQMAQQARVQLTQSNDSDSVQSSSNESSAESANANSAEKNDATVGFTSGGLAANDDLESESDQKQDGDSEFGSRYSGVHANLLEAFFSHQAVTAGRFVSEHI